MKRNSLLLSLLAGILIVVTGVCLAVFQKLTVMLDWEDVDWVFDRIG